MFSVFLISLFLLIWFLKNKKKRGNLVSFWCNTLFSDTRMPTAAKALILLVDETQIFPKKPCSDLK